MHITFVGFGWEQLGLAQLSAIARWHGHTVGLAFSAGLFDDRYNLRSLLLAGVFQDDDDVLQEICRQRPDVVAFSPLTATYQWMLMIAGRAKCLMPGVATVFGGAHVSAVPERIVRESQVDFICVGEGDEAFVDILDMIERGRANRVLANVWYRESDGRIVRGPTAPFVQDLDALPVFDKTLWEEVVSFEDIYFTMASRGCPHRCTYCFNDYYADLGKGRYVRYRSPDHVIRELRWAKQRYRLRLIEFEDDVFTLNRPWLKELMTLYRREIGLPFQCLTHPKYMNDETARILKEAGCRYVQMGIQSMDDRYKRAVLNRKETHQDVERALASMKRHRLQVKIDHMFALPGEPLAAQEKALAVYRRYPPYRMQTFWTNYFPGTSIMEFAYRQGHISREDKENILSGRVADDYRNSEKVNDPRALHVYKAYECLFKMLTVMPPWLRERASVKPFLWLPDRLLSLITFMADLCAGLVRRNPDHWAYAKYYAFHMKRLLLKKTMREPSGKVLINPRPAIVPE